MTAEEVAEDVQAFLHEHIETYEQLATLALLFENRESWNVERVALRTHVSEEDALHALVELCDMGFVVADATGDVRSFRYSASSPASETIARLAGLYTSQPLEIMRLMNANAMERVRTSMARSFASAFLVGRKK